MKAKTGLKKTKSTFLTMIMFLMLVFITVNCKAQIEYIGKPTINYVKSHDKVLNLKLLYGTRRYGLHLDYSKTWKLDKQKKWFLGFGLQATSFLCKQQLYETAPTKIIKNSKSLLAAAFPTVDEKLDTFHVASGAILMANFYINVMHRINYHHEIGIALDLGGITLGLPVEGYIQSSLINGGGVSDKALPTFFNYILLGSNNHGSLLYHLYYQYWLNDKLGLACSVNYLYTEYRTHDALVFDNRRYRNTSISFMAGICYAPFHRKTNKTEF